MKSWLKQLWLDPEAFQAAIRTLIGFAVTLGGALVTVGYVPTDGDNWKFGPVIMALSKLVPSQPVAPASRRPE